jgi:hypothetical protein
MKLTRAKAHVGRLANIVLILMCLFIGGSYGCVLADSFRRSFRGCGRDGSSDPVKHLLIAQNQKSRSM